MRRRKEQLTLGELIEAVSQYARNAEELRLTVTDLMERGVVTTRKRHRHFKVVGHAS